MSPTVIQGQALGSIITVQDSTALAALSTQGISVGTAVYNAAVGTNFVLTVSTAGLVTDSIVAVSGITGLRWIKKAAGTVLSVTGPAVDNTDPANPVVNKTATTAADGLLPKRSFAVAVAFGADLTDASVTVNPGVDGAGAYLMPAGTMTQARTLTLGHTGIRARQIVQIVVEPQSFDLTVADSVSGGIELVTANAKTIVYQYFNNAGTWALNTNWNGNT